MAAGIHWYPGHMAAASKEILRYLKIIDIVVEIIDARAPISSRHPYFATYEGPKSHLLIMAKSDLADGYATTRWRQFYAEKGFSTLALNLQEPASVPTIIRAIKDIGAPLWEKQAAKGMKPQPLRAMIVGIPNVGKSTLINRLAHKNAVNVENRPGVTRAPQWIKPDDKIWLLDTPGILPTNYELKVTAINLALIGSVKRDILPIETLSEHLYHFMASGYPHLFESYLGGRIPPTYEATLDHVATRFGLLSQGMPARDQAAWRLYQDFKDGVIGPMTLEVAY